MKSAEPTDNLRTAITASQIDPAAKDMAIPGLARRNALRRLINPDDPFCSGREGRLPRIGDIASRTASLVWLSAGIRRALGKDGACRNSRMLLFPEKRSPGIQA